jgi:hypothetical protein
MWLHAHVCLRDSGCAHIGTRWGIGGMYCYKCPTLNSNSSSQWVCTCGVGEVTCHAIVYKQSHSAVL